MLFINHDNFVHHGIMNPAKPNKNRKRPLKLFTNNKLTASFHLYRDLNTINELQCCWDCSLYKHDISLRCQTPLCDIIKVQRIVTFWINAYVSNTSIASVPIFHIIFFCTSSFCILKVFYLFPFEDRLPIWGVDFIILALLLEKNINNQLGPS